MELDALDPRSAIKSAGSAPARSAWPAARTAEVRARQRRSEPVANVFLAQRALLVSVPLREPLGKCVFNFVASQRTILVAVQGCKKSWGHEIFGSESAAPAARRPRVVRRRQDFAETSGELLRTDRPGFIAI